MKRTAPAKIDVVVAGYLGVDLAPKFRPGQSALISGKAFSPGKLIETEGLEISLGGVVANTGLAMKKFGRRVELMGCLGDDELGAIATRLFRAHGVTRGIRRNGRARTGYGIVLAPPGIDRIYLEDPGCNATFSSSDIDYDVVKRSRLFHLGYPPLMKRLWASGGAELRRMLSHVRRLGVATSMDMALPDPDGAARDADWNAILKAALPHVDIFVPSVEEILLMMEPKECAHLRRDSTSGEWGDAIPDALVENVGRRILELGVKIVMIKAGHRGAYICTGDVSNLRSMLAVDLLVTNWSNRSFWTGVYPAQPDKFRNASGAGDCAVAGFLSAILSGAKIERAANYAMLAGRDNLYGADAYSGLRSWRTMTSAISQRKPLPR